MTTEVVHFLTVALVHFRVDVQTFTATPRNVTLERFGERGPDGLPRPFHLYAMRQAIEEGFILDVLRHYMMYNTYYQLEKAVEDDPELGSRRGQGQVARYASLHPEAIEQKAEIIVEHFRDNVMNELDGGAKAMVVTSSRAHALQIYPSSSRQRCQKRSHQRTLTKMASCLSGEGFGASTD